MSEICEICKEPKNDHTASELFDCARVIMDQEVRDVDDKQKLFDETLNFNEKYPDLNPDGTNAD